jgi:hypothetical protein
MCSEYYVYINRLLIYISVPKYEIEIKLTIFEGTTNNELDCTRCYAILHQHFNMTDDQLLEQGEILNDGWHLNGTR